jgi:hypothetical protein
MKCASLRQVEWKACHRTMLMESLSPDDAIEVAKRIIDGGD